jgi:hypothetical protein
MRTPRDSLLILGLLTVGCLLLGVVAGVAMGKQIPNVASPQTADPHRPIPATSLAQTQAAQFSVLLVGVDSLNASQPKLEACWVVTFQPGTQQYYVLGFSPDTAIALPGEATPQPLATIYNLDHQIGRGDIFTRDALRVISPGLSFQAEVMFDRLMLAQTIDMLGGISLNGQWLNGPGLLTLYDQLPPDQPAERLMFQQQALTALADTAKQQNWTTETLSPFFDLGQEWSPDQGFLFTLAQAALPISQAEFFITNAPLVLEH